MTAATVTDSHLALARSAAQAALAVLPTSSPLQVGAPVVGAIQGLPDGQAVTARFSGAATGEVVVIVGADLAEALRTSPLGELDLATAVRPALEGAARAFGPVVLDPGQVMEPAVALSALTIKDDMTVSVPLLEGGEMRAAVAVLLSPWPSESGDVAPRATAPPTAVRAGLEMLHDVEMEVSAELGRTRMNVRDLLSVAPGTIVELGRAAGSPADLLVNGRLIARGEVVVIDENFGIRITEIMTPNE